ncbi:MAG: D-alanine--D-alanine ligase [Bacteroidetes bacterium]|nr:D-alanine--D-alanine ligase [Bacteroidota bacterium]
MIIGFTYDLRSDYLREGFTEEETAEFDRESTIEGIEGALHGLGYQTDRIGHVKNLTQRLVKGDRWDMVFNICEGIHGIGREAQVPALLDAYNIPYTFSDPLVLSLTLHKGMTKRVIRDCGLATPDFAMVMVPGDVEMIRLPYPLFVKPAAEGTGKGIDAKSRVNNKAELLEVCKSLLTRFSLGLIVETFMPGREFTVGIAGTGEKARVLGIMEVHLKAEAEAHSYTYVNKENCDDLVVYSVPKDNVAERSRELALASWRCLNCRDAGRVDLRADVNGIPNFLEVNPLAGLHPIHSDLPIICKFQGIPFQELIRFIMDSARERTGF